jgi:fumarate hydratase class II
VPVIGYDRAAQLAHYAMEHDLTLRAAAQALGVIDADTFDRIVDARKMLEPGV